MNYAAQVSRRHPAIGLIFEIEGITWRVCEYEEYFGDNWYHCRSDRRSKFAFSESHLFPLLVEELLRTPAMFREWLESKSPYEVVGESAHCYTCPVAWFLQSFGINANVSEDWIVPIVGAVRLDAIEAPQWLSDFTLSIDACKGATVTAKTCLMVLDLFELTAA